MLFQTPEFVALFLATLLTFYTIGQRFRLVVLAIASTLFYAASGLADLTVFIATILVSYAISTRLKQDGPRWPLYAAVCLMLGSLAYYKYGGFFFDNLDPVWGLDKLISRDTAISTILPLGISFYTFQIVAYFNDVHRGTTRPASSFLQYFVFVSFFAQLIAGPIMRGSRYLPQLAILRSASREEFGNGALLVLSGLVKKVIIADTLATTVDRLFVSDSFTQPEAMVAAGLFAFQIYFDFSGYVDIARGLAKMLGIKLDENFRTPYVSGSFGEFWQRWHITLSQWFRDYVYIPLGGNRVGRTREVGNLLLVMAIAGLWHGAGWQFVLWGAIHGVMLVIQRFVPSVYIQFILPSSDKARERTYRVISVAVVFTLITLAWIPFRAGSLEESKLMYQAIFSFTEAGSWIDYWQELSVFGMLFAAQYLERFVRESSEHRSRIERWIPSEVRGVSYGVVIVAIIGFSAGPQNFIYFRF